MPAALLFLLSGFVPSTVRGRNEPCMGMPKLVGFWGCELSQSGLFTASERKRFALPEVRNDKGNGLFA